MVRIAVGGEDRDVVAEILQTHGGVNHQSFRPTYTEIWMNENHASRFDCRCIRHVVVGVRV